MIGRLIIFLAKTKNCSQPRRPTGGVLDIGADIQKPYIIGVAGPIGVRNLDSWAIVLHQGAVSQGQTVFGVATVHKGGVAANLQAAYELVVNSTQPLVQGQGGLSAIGVAGFVLFFLVAVHGILQEMGKIVPERHAAVDEVAAGRKLPSIARSAIMSRKADPF